MGDECDVTWIIASAKSLLVAGAVRVRRLFAENMSSIWDTNMSMVSPGSSLVSRNMDSSSAR